MLSSPPSEKILGRLYWELALIGAEAVGKKHPWPYRFASREELFCFACDVSRYDPRLITVLTTFLTEHWHSLNPACIRSFYPAMSMPQTVAVIVEFFVNASDQHEINYYGNYLQRGLQSVPTQFYFHHLYLPGGTLAQRAATTPLAEYKRWGFLACEAPRLDTQRKKKSGTFDNVSRRNILRRLLKQRKRISIADYLQACHYTVSRQQALSDLRHCDAATLKGRGRGAYWIFRDAENEAENKY